MSAAPKKAPKEEAKEIPSWPLTGLEIDKRRGELNAQLDEANRRRSEIITVRARLGEVKALIKETDLGQEQDQLKDDLAGIESILTQTQTSIERLAWEVSNGRTREPQETIPGTAKHEAQAAQAAPKGSAESRTLSIDDLPGVRVIDATFEPVVPPARQLGQGDSVTSAATAETEEAAPDTHPSQRDRAATGSDPALVRETLIGGVLIEVIVKLKAGHVFPIEEFVGMVNGLLGDRGEQLASIIEVKRALLNAEKGGRVTFGTTPKGHHGYARAGKAPKAGGSSYERELRETVRSCILDAIDGTQMGLMGHSALYRAMGIEESSTEEPAVRFRAVLVQLLDSKAIEAVTTSKGPAYQRRATATATAPATTTPKASKGSKAGAKAATATKTAKAGKAVTL